MGAGGWGAGARRALVAGTRLGDSGAINLLDSAPPGPAPVQIAAFDPLLTVMVSKQRPRRLAILGSDGRRYLYLLKGQEDLRQDERVMQLFRLVNAFLRRDPQCALWRLSIQPYAVVPMSDTSGILEWVPAAETVQNLVVGYRRRRFMAGAHGKSAAQVTDPEGLALRDRLLTTVALQSAWEPHKLEAFFECLKTTDGSDLGRSFWVNAPAAEAWFAYRRTFSRSLAVMSMVGYLLGLGDRHPSNLMVRRHTGMVVHIDFGDCFEVAMRRPYLPERVPFRLTRMLVSALGPAGTQGTFLRSAQHVVRVLRVRKSTLLALLGAFVFDPLVKWKSRRPPRRRHSALPEAPTATGDPTHAALATAEAEPAPAASGSFESPLSGLLQSGHSRRSGLRAGPATLLPGDPDSGSDSDHSDDPDVQGNTDPDTRRIRRLYRQLGPAPRFNPRAIEAVARVNEKLLGCDFSNTVPFSVAKQVEFLMLQATAAENLATAFIGYQPYW